MLRVLFRAINRRDARALCEKVEAQLPADAVGCAGNEDMTSLEIHTWPIVAENNGTGARYLPSLLPICYDRHMDLPNILTMGRFALAVLGALTLLFVPDPLRFPLALGIFVVSAASDWLDGVLARRMGRYSPF